MNFPGYTGKQISEAWEIVFSSEVQRDNEQINLANQVANLEIARINRKRDPEYKMTEADIKRNAILTAGLRKYTSQTLLRKSGNLQAIEDKESKARFEVLPPVNILEELERIRYYAWKGVWR